MTTKKFFVRYPSYMGFHHYLALILYNAQKEKTCPQMYIQRVNYEKNHNKNPKYESFKNMLRH
jgi:hypothetical protein